MADPSPTPVSVFRAQIIDEEIAALSTFLTESGQALLGKPVDGSGIKNIVTWIVDLPHATLAERQRNEALIHVIDESGSSVRRLLANAVDHALALAAALRADESVTGAALTLSRAVLEAVLQACTILDPNVKPLTAILRALAYEIATVEGNEETAKALAKIATDEQKALATQNVDELHEWLGQHGFTRLRKGKDGRRTVKVGFQGAWSAIEFDATAAMKRYLFGEDYFYALQSGAAHSRGWLLSTTYLPDSPARRQTPGQIQLVALLPLLDASETLAKSVAFYAGTDATAVIEATHRRRIALIAGHGNPGSTISLAEYRARSRK